MRLIRRTEKRTFTLIELLVVIGIIAILAGLLLVAVFKGKDLTTANATKSYMTTLSIPLAQLYNSEEGPFKTNFGPGNGTGTSDYVDVTNATFKDYLIAKKVISEKPTDGYDPWGNPLKFQISNTGTLKIYSFGPNRINNGGRGLQGLEVSDNPDEDDVGFQMDL